MALYDVVLANEEEFFTSRIRELCGAHDLSFFLVEPIWLRGFLNKLKLGDVGVGVLLDMASDPYDRSDLYYRLAREVKASGGYVIDDPDRTPLATHKAKFHAVLVQHGIDVPETIIVRRDELAAFRVTDEVRARIGRSFVAKPGWGSGRRGVILNASTRADIARSLQQAPRSDTVLLQKRLVPKTLDGRPGWFRVFYVCGEIIPCWWHPTTSDYEMVSPLQRRRFGLQRLDQIVHKIAGLSGVEFFSTEIAVTESAELIAVDYLNDECDMHAKSYWPSGPPDEVVRRVAWLMVQRAMTVLRKHPFGQELRDRDAADHYRLVTATA